MENNQDFQSNENSGTARTAGNRTAGRPAGACFEVTYLDTSCGLIRSELFDDAAAADRFASRCVADEDGWAVVDAVHPGEGRAAA
ncbi:hypothetical protein [Arthrobacter oryzae]|uniref:Uncharacterized protein n=1 Tax=Arthrobacter oryzae TaxID=409290 RepID=A0A3N0BMT9_9MICC|nr:hypothetical protein [Arthrobacter oryzae]RNL50041.1 hypothetical protein D7003_18240 [Arthrobacter oryzae]